MSRGHTTATHNRAAYADYPNCAACRAQFEHQNGVSYQAAVLRSQQDIERKTDDIMGMVVVVVGLLIFLGLVISFIDLIVSSF